MGRTTRVDRKQVFGWCPSGRLIGPRSGSLESLVSVGLLDQPSREVRVQVLRWFSEGERTPTLRTGGGESSTSPSRLSDPPPDGLIDGKKSTDVGSRFECPRDDDLEIDQRRGL